MLRLPYRDAWRLLCLVPPPPKLQLEDQLKRGLEDMGDEEAAEAVASFEIKYNRLKERYKVRVWAARR